MSDADQHRNAHLLDQNRSKSWIFSANLNIQKQLNAEEGSDLISPDYFNKAINDCFPYQAAHLKPEVLSFSFDPEWTHLLPGDALGVTGLLVNKNQISRRKIRSVVDMVWSACRQDKNPRVTEFLPHSALHDDFFAALAGGGADRVPNLRVDKIGQSAPKRNGRPPKRTQPDAGFNDAGGACMPAPSRARPAPADSTPPGAAAAAGAGGASGPPPSPAADPAAAAGGQTTMPPTPARRRRRPHARSGDAGGVRMPALARARPPPADSTPPGAAAAAGAGAASGPSPSPAAPAADPAAPPGDPATTLPTPARLSDASARSESGLERMLAEFQKMNQRLERLIGVIECIAESRNGECCDEISIIILFFIIA